MVHGYEELIERIFEAKMVGSGARGFATGGRHAS
jgi:hypothetical protein